MLIMHSVVSLSACQLVRCLKDMDACIAELLAACRKIQELFYWNSYIYIYLYNALNRPAQVGKNLKKIQEMLMQFLIENFAMISWPSRSMTFESLMNVEQCKYREKYEYCM